jgi:hypothetical protein
LENCKNFPVTNRDLASWTQLKHEIILYWVGLKICKKKRSISISFTLFRFCKKMLHLLVQIKSTPMSVRPTTGKEITAFLLWWFRLCSAQHHLLLCPPLTL